MPHSKPTSLDFSAAVSSPELLAPAGTLSALLAAVQNGADAVYMGASRFSARAFAGNFSDYELAAGIDYAHAFGKKVYVTLNTLYHDDELDDVLSLFDDLYKIGVDGVIVQDLGLLSLLSEKYPDFAVHASTQMTVHNSYHAEFLKKKGVVRIVPARENSVPELKAIKQTGVEVETFIHGALCICYSGQCLFSSLVGSRSGNRGKCAQPCRKKYTLMVGARPVSTVGQYLLSPKDLNSSENLRKLMDAGVDSFKIEGRMKKPEYVAGVVSVYRALINRILIQKATAAGSDSSAPELMVSDASVSGLPTLSEKEKLKKLFNRDFTSGYFDSNPENALMSRKLPYNKGILIGKIVRTDDKSRKIQVLLTSELSAHDGISIGNLEAEVRSTKDPRQGFPINKMYIGRSICSKASAGDTVEIPLPHFSDNPMPIPNVGDSVYKTFDFELQKELSKTFPNLDETEGAAEEIAALRQMLEETYAADFLNVSENRLSSADTFPIAELIEKLSPSESLQVTVSQACSVSVGLPISITATDADGCSVIVCSEYIVESALKNPFTKAQAADLLSKLGNTIYQVGSVDVSVSGDCFVPVGEFKNTRNKALQALLTKRIEKSRRFPIADAVPLKCGAFCSDSENEAAAFSSHSGFSPISEALVSVSVYSAPQLKAALDAGADRIYLGGDIFKNPLAGETYGLAVNEFTSIAADLSAADKEKIFFKTPFVTKENDFLSLKNDLEALSSLGLFGIASSNLGVFEFLKTDDVFFDKFRIAADSAFNIFNAAAAEMILSDGAESILLSQEMSISDISKLAQKLSVKIQNPPLECLVHGRQRLMITEHPLLESLLESPGLILESSKNPSSLSSSAPSFSLSDFMLKDAKNYSFPILTDTNRRNHIFNSKELNAFGLIPRLLAAGVSIFRIEGLGYSADEIFDLTARYKEEVKQTAAGKVKSNGASDGAQFTNGSFLRGVE